VTTTAYQNLFQTFGLKENPFRIAPDPRFLFLGHVYEATLSELMLGVESHSGLLVLTGEPGTGKTMLVRHFLQRLNQKKFSSSYIFHASLNAAGIFELIAQDFDLRVESHRKSDLLGSLERWLQVRQAEGDSPVVVIDEAQALSVRALNELGLLLNLENSEGKLLQLLLAGQPELDEKLRQPGLRQLRHRVSVRCRLPLLSLEETCEYIAARLRSAGGSNAQIFPVESLEALYSYAQGVPRVTNLLCEKALIAAYAEKGLVVSPGNVRQAAAEFDFALEPRATAVAQIPLQTSAVLPLHAQELPAEPETSPTVPDEPRQVVESVVDLPIAPVEARSKPNVTVLTPKPAMQEPAPPEPALELRATAVPEISLETSAVVPLHAQEPAAEPAASPRVADEPQRVVESGVDLPIAPVETRSKPNVTVLTPKPPMQEPGPPDRAPVEHPVARKTAWQRRRENSFRRYWREVAQSFVRDWRHFLGAFQTRAAPDGKVLFMKKYDFRRDLVAPVSRWLNKPVTLKGTRGGESDRRAGRGTF